MLLDERLAFSHASEAIPFVQIEKAFQPFSRIHMRSNHLSNDQRTIAGLEDFYKRALEISYGVGQKRCAHFGWLLQHKACALDFVYTASMAGPGR